MDIYITILLTILIICILSTYVYLPFVTVTGGNFNKCNSQPKINFDKLKIFSKEKLQIISNMNFEKINMLSNLDEDNLNFLLNLDNDKFNTFINLDNQKFDTIMKLDNQKLGELINLDNQKFDTLMKLDNQKFDSLVNLDNQKLNNLINLDSKKLGDLINLDNQKFSDLVKLDNEKLDTLIYLDNEEFYDIMYPKNILNDEAYIRNIDDYLRLYPKQEKNVRKRHIQFTDDKQQVLQPIYVQQELPPVKLVQPKLGIQEEKIYVKDIENIKNNYSKILDAINPLIVTEQINNFDKNDEQIKSLNVKDEQILNKIYYNILDLEKSEKKSLLNVGQEFPLNKVLFFVDSPDMYYFNLTKNSENIDCLGNNPIDFLNNQILSNKIIYELYIDSYEIRKNIYIKEEDILKYLDRNICEKKVLLSKISDLINKYLEYLNNYYSIFYNIKQKLIIKKYKLKDLFINDFNDYQKYELLPNLFLNNIIKIKNYITTLPGIISKDEINNLKNKLNYFRNEQIEILKDNNFIKKINLGIII